MPDPEAGTYPDRLKAAGDIVPSGAYYDVLTAPDALKRYMRKVRAGQPPSLEGLGPIRSIAGQKACIAAGFKLLDQLSQFPAKWFRAAELEHLEKALVQSGYAPGWHVIPGGLRRDGDVSLARGLQCVLEYLVVEGKQGDALSGASYPRNTNKGWPTYGTSDRELLLHVAGGASVRHYDDVAEVGAYIAQRLGDDIAAGLEPHAVMWSRTGPRKKPQDVYSWQNSDLVRVGWSKGFYPRRRHVFGLPTFVNASFRLEVIREKLLMRSTRVFGHSYRSVTAGQVAAARRRRLRVLSDDIAGFDQSVPALHQEELATVIHQALFQEKDLVDVYLRAARDMAVLSPPLVAGHDSAMLRKKGMIASGHGGTSMDGSFINTARVFYAVAAAMGWDGPERALKGLLAREWELWIWGDDTLIAVPEGFDDDKYVAESTRLGYTCALSDAPVFLMVCYAPDGTHWNLASRAFVQTVWRERPSATESLALFGLWTRWNLTAGHPLRSALWRAITDASATDGLLASRRLFTPTDLDQLMSSPEFKAEFQNDLKTRPASVNDLISSLTRGTYDLSVNPDAGYALALMGRTIISDSTWRPPGRVGVRGLDPTEGRRILEEAIDVNLGYRTAVSEGNDPDALSKNADFVIEDTPDE